MIGLRFFGLLVVSFATWWTAYPFASEYFYDGDGELSVDGIYPLVDYKITMPVFKLSDSPTQQFKISHFTSGLSNHLSLCIQLEQPFDFLTLKARAKLEVVRGDGVVIFSIDQPLNDPDRFADMTETEYRVTQAQGYSTWYSYRGNNRKISSQHCFSVMDLPRNIYFDWWESYDLRITLSDVDQEMAEADMHLRVSQGWK